MYAIGLWTTQATDEKGKGDSFVTDSSLARFVSKRFE